MKAMAAAIAGMAERDPGSSRRDYGTSLRDGAGLITLAVARPLPGITSQARWLRIAGPLIRRGDPVAGPGGVLPVRRTEARTCPMAAAIASSRSLVAC